MVFDSTPESARGCFMADWLNPGSYAGHGLLLRHSGRVMTGNEPLFAVPPIGEGVTRTDLSARFCEIKRIETCVYSRVAANIYHSQINFS